MDMDAYDPNDPYAALNSSLPIPRLGQEEDEEEEDNFTAADPAGLTARLMTAVQNTQKRQEALDQQRMAMLQQATERLRQQQAGPSLAEQLFRLSAAFAQPSRTKGLAGMLGNVMPVLAQNASESQAAKLAKQDLLEKYQLQGLDMQSGAAGTQLKNLLAAYATAGKLNKPTTRRTAISPVDGRIYDLDTGEEIARKSAGSGSAPHVSSQAEVDALPPEVTEFIGPDGVRRHRKPRGPTGGSPSSGGF